MVAHISPSGRAEQAGFEPASVAVKVLCLTAWRLPYVDTYIRLLPYLDSESNWVHRGNVVTLVFPLRFKLFRVPPIICSVCYFLTWFRFHESERQESNLLSGYSPVSAARPLCTESRLPCSVGVLLPITRPCGKAPNALRSEVGRASKDC